MAFKLVCATLTKLGVIIAVKKKMLAKTDIALITHVFLFVKLWPSVES